ncbi:MAG: hypothetical protein P4L40_19355 [Terracidiphilus sp.]|nr:hypothetical protein [Terracidiphilus sp.]
MIEIEPPKHSPHGLRTRRFGVGRVDTLGQTNVGIDDLCSADVLGGFFTDAGAEDAVRDLIVTAFSAVAELAREDLRNVRAALVGRFCAASCASAAFALLNDLRLRWPLVSRQSAKNFCPFWNMVSFLDTLGHLAM